MVVVCRVCRAVWLVMRLCSSFLCFRLSGKEDLFRSSSFLVPFVFVVLPAFLVLLGASIHHACSSFMPLRCLSFVCLLACLLGWLVGCSPQKWFDPTICLANRSVTELTERSMKPRQSPRERWDDVE